MPALRPLPRPTVETAHLPAPVGGINTVAPASAMPETDCPYLWNCTSAELGLRSRLGWKEWATGLGGAVNSVLDFTGSHASGSTDRVFAVTPQGIWDVTASTQAPVRLVTFGTTTGNAGFGVSTEVSTPAGRFLVYCDEENGAYVWSENGAAWAKVLLGVNQSWAPNTAYLVGNQVLNGGNAYVCAVGGVSASSGGPAGAGAGIGDGTATWNYVSAAVGSTIGPSLADQQAGFTGNPSGFAACVVWKSRLWFVEKDSSRAWYLPVSSLFGVATSFDFGFKMRAGGPLANLFNWTYDGGGGLDTSLVGISTAGDVVIYQGTDPSSANTFGLKGCWYVPGVPFGRHIATDFGGDVLIMSRVGLIALSKLVSGKAMQPELYETYKVSNLFNLLASQYGTLQGWQVALHPEDNALLILVPQPNAESQPLAMSMATRGWGRYRDVPMLSMCTYGGQLYFGTPDGRVCINTGYLDGVLLSDANSGSPVSCSVLFPYNNLGNALQKRVHSLRPSLISQQPAPPVMAWAKFNYDLTEPPEPSDTTATAGTWGNAYWGVDVWGGDTASYEPLLGATGMGRSVAVAVRFLASTRTSLVGVDVFFEQGGPL